MGRTTVTRLLARGLVSVLLALAGLMVFANPAAAHSKLVSTEPSAGSTVSTLSRVVLRFEEPVETTGVHVWLEDDGGAFELGAPQYLDGDQRNVVFAVPAIASGRYTVGYHIVAEDGDVATGSFGFALDTPPVAGAAEEPLPPASPATAAPSVELHESHDGDLPASAARVILDAALASFVGGLAFIATVWPQGASFASARRLLWIAAIVAAVASFGLAVLQHATATGLGLAAAVGPAHLAQALQFRFGRVAAARLVLLVFAAALTRRLPRDAASTKRSLRWCAAASAIAVGLFETVVLLGHNGNGGSIAEGARLVHTIGVSIWMGGLLMLFAVVLPRRRSDELVAVLPRFSTLATIAVGSVLVAGVLLAIDLVGAAEALPTTSYGRILLLKLVVVAVLLLVASRSRDTVRRRLANATTTRGRIALAGPVATWVGIELGLMTVVFGLTALLVAHAPPA